MKYRWLEFGFLFFTGCMASNALQYESASETNLYHLARVRKGMNEKQVLQIMHKPYSYESFQVEDDIYDVWFYVTRSTGLDQTRMVPQNLTPLTFKNGILVGTGYNWYYYAMREQAKEAEAQKPAPVKPPSQEAEDKEFEKLLKSPSQKAQPPAKAPEPENQNLEKALTPPKSPKPQEQPKLPPNVHVISKNQLVLSQREYGKLRKGMTEEQVEQSLGEPIEKEAFSIDGDAYEAWFYPVKNKYVPITFKNGHVLGRTMKDYNEVRQKAGLECIDCYTPAAERMQEDESEQNFNYW